RRLAGWSQLARQRERHMKLGRLRFVRVCRGCQHGQARQEILHSKIRYEWSRHVNPQGENVDRWISCSILETLQWPAVSTRCATRTFRGLAPPVLRIKSRRSSSSL